MTEIIEKRKKRKIQVGSMLNFGYFRGAQLLIEYLLSQKNIGKSFTSKDIIQKYPDYDPPFTLENGAIFLAARYNFKHALELSMKSLFLNAKMIVPTGHNLQDICKKMRIELLSKSILEPSLTAWEWLIDRYYINDKFAPKDKNELDRYMVSLNGNKFPYKKIHDLKRKDLTDFLRDIKTAKNLFYEMDSECDFIKSCNKFNFNPSIKSRECSKIIICKLKDGRYITKRKSGVFKSKMLDF
ncbi:MAG: hypothetical protein KAI16_02810 [Candidatus Pacebacteria bacterium]|nr:hypothetical protein [Candidatus Paceibacterota bacterium]